MSSPVLRAVVPSQGPTTRGASVLRLGAGLTETTAVLFGSTPALGFTVGFDGAVTAVAPPGTGTVRITVATAAGTGNGASCTSAPHDDRAAASTRRSNTAIGVGCRRRRHLAAICQEPGAAVPSVRESRVRSGPAGPRPGGGADEKKAFRGVPDRDGHEVPNPAARRTATRKLHRRRPMAVPVIETVSDWAGVRTRNDLLAAAEGAARPRGEAPTSLSPSTAPAPTARTDLDPATENAPPSGPIRTPNSLRLTGGSPAAQRARSAGSTASDISTAAPPRPRWGPRGPEGACNVGGGAQTRRPVTGRLVHGGRSPGPGRPARRSLRPLMAGKRDVAVSRGCRAGPGRAPIPGWPR
ncbi:IPT/TIG domain-containing protein [Kitasatospora sp. NPDC085895]|uniref:IPT/TIG domain-containing protein n=1 Tax=Kitasatospora sp. NPDC085895 TaxID=3155057 RepID=UPI0034503201